MLYPDKMTNFAYRHYKQFNELFYSSNSKMSEEILFSIRTLQGSVIKSLFDTLKVRY